MRVVKIKTIKHDKIKIILKETFLHLEISITLLAEDHSSSSNTEASRIHMVLVSSSLNKIPILNNIQTNIDHLHLDYPGTSIPSRCLEAHCLNQVLAIIIVSRGRVRNNNRRARTLIITSPD